MWKKIMLKLLISMIASIDINQLMTKIMKRLAEIIKARTGHDIDLSSIDNNELLAMVEEVIANHLGIEVDLNRDGKAGDGQPGYSHRV